MKYFVKTFGCQMNEADSEKISGVLEKKGYKPVLKPEEADLVVINSCSVRESAENRVFGLANNLNKLEKPPHIILTGCMVGSAREERRRYPISELKKKLPNVDEFKLIKELIDSSSFSKRKKKISALVPIMEGCNNFCSYCVVPYGRGKEESLPLDEIICEIERLAKDGCKEIVLLGQNVNSYGNDKTGKSFANLLKKIHGIEGIEKISFLTSNPWDLSDEIIEVMKLPKIDRYLHLPVQSGDDEILKRMNRSYKVKDYLNLVKKIRKEIPDIKIGTDIIVGFPGETKKQFENTVKLCKEVGFDRAFVNRYSPRKGTVAFKLKDDVFPPEKRKRWRILDNLIN